MIAALTTALNRGLVFLGRISMYRMVLVALSVLAAVALLLSVFGLVLPTPGALLGTAVVLVVVGGAVDALAQRMLGLPWRVESSLITAGILLFVLRPSAEPVGLAGIAIAAAAASVSKYLLAWRGRHVFNPAAVGATVLTLVAALAPLEWNLGGSAWWVGSPALFAPVLLLGIGVLWRSERLPVAGLFLVVAVVVAVARVQVQYGQLGVDLPFGEVLAQTLFASPYLFLAVFMLSEPLTLPPRRWQQFLVAAVVGVLAGWPIQLGLMSLGQERALLIGNLVAFAFCLRSAVRLRLERSEESAPTVRELTFRAERMLRFEAGQYLELEVPHRRPDIRGTRREFSILSAPEDLPTVRVAYRDRGETPSSYKRALAEAAPGDVLSVTGVWGDFVLPRDPGRPVLMVAAGIGVTPFVSQLRHLAATGERRDVVLVYVVPEGVGLPFRGDLAASGVPVVVFSRTDPGELPPGWTWTGGVRLDADALAAAVPDLRERHAYISGPPGLIADLAPALSRARGLTTDAFAGY
ncbi:FAD-dependent oxidoreductase [Microbacterium sp. GXF7504]